MGSSLLLNPIPIIIINENFLDMLGHNPINSKISHCWFFIQVIIKCSNQFYMSNTNGILHTFNMIHSISRKVAGGGIDYSGYIVVGVF